MAYMRLMLLSCSYGGCRKEGRYAVFTNRNAHMGDYCKPHAGDTVARLKKEEERNYGQEKA